MKISDSVKLQTSEPVSIQPQLIQQEGIRNQKTNPQLPNNNEYTFDFTDIQIFPPPPKKTCQSNKTRVKWKRPNQNKIIA